MYQRLRPQQWYLVSTESSENLSCQCHILKNYTLLRRHLKLDFVILFTLKIEGSLALPLFHWSHGMICQHHREPAGITGQEILFSYCRDPFYPLRDPDGGKKRQQDNKFLDRWESKLTPCRWKIFVEEDVFSLPSSSGSFQIAIIYWYLARTPKKHFLPI